MLFMRTGATRTKPRRVPWAVLVAAVVLATSGSGWAANLADLAGPLRSLAAADRANTLSPGDPQARLLGVSNGRALVDVRFTGSAAGETVALARLGARVHRTSGNLAQVVAPLSSLVDIACLPNVALVTPAEQMIPLFGATLSEGVQLTNALSLQAQGLTGLGIRVAVIDLGFLDYDTAELPTTVVTRAFRSDGIINGITDHGTAVAEVIVDMAPNADLYLLSVNTPTDVEAALEYCLQNDIDIANLSIGVTTGPFDGTHALDEAIDRTRAAGVLPVVSAGNFAQRHWAGDWTDADGDTLLEYDTSDEGISVTTTAAGQEIQVQLSWFQTASAQGTRADLTDRDYDIELVNPTGVVIATSAVTQNGNDPPAESLLAYAGAAGAYDIRIRAMSPNIATGPTDSFQLFCTTHDFETVLQVPETSLSIPATAAGSLTIGATRAVADLPDPAVDYPVDTLEPFSSWGPTVDGRDKPDLCGPDYVGTGTAGNAIFNGTSAAAPHVTGGAALLKSEDQTRTPNELSDVLSRLATAQNAIVPVRLIDSTLADLNQCGAGRLSLRSGLDTKPPMISITFPINGTTITTAQPTIVGVITDTETGVDQGTIVMTLDGVEVQWDSFSPGSGVVTYTPPAPLSRSAHTIRLDASDTAGNPGVAAVANFRVGLPTLSAGLHLISLPYRNLLDARPASIFGIGEAEVALVRWIPTDAAFSKYRIYPDPLATFEPPDAVGANPTVVSPPAGLGYFVNLPREVVLNIAGEALADVTDYTIQLPYGTSDPRGWHMIGNPYQDTVDWSTVQFVTNGVRRDLDQAIADGITEGFIFEYVPAAGAIAGHYEFTSPQSAVLEPMKGYWLHVRTSTAVIIYPATVAGASAEKPADKPAMPAADNWRAQIVATAPSLLDRCNYFGVAPNASTGHDVASDVPEPPAIGNSLRLYFPHRDWGAARGEYAQDLQARGAGALTWEFEVACPKAGAQVTLSWPELNATVPGEVAVTLEDLDNGRTVFMRGATSYAFRAGDGGPRHFRLTADRAGASGLQITSLSAAQARDGSVAIAYDLSASAAVSADIRNIAGRVVRGLVAGRQVSAGAQTLLWDARNDAGVRVPAGTYLLQLTAKTADGQTVRRICPINAAR
ncbi:MAG: hypothetical protein FJX74_08765 [Armatimonadetes bacterium]|nr:hypothetical protein [Armatimonadota bacterium]